MKTNQSHPFPLKESFTSFHNRIANLSSTELHSRLQGSFWDRLFHHKSKMTKDNVMNCEKMSRVVSDMSETSNSSFSINSETIVNKLRSVTQYSCSTLCFKKSKHTSSTSTETPKIFFGKRFYKTPENQIRSEPCIFKLYQMSKINTDIFKRNNKKTGSQDKYLNTSTKTLCNSNCNGSKINQKRVGIFGYPCMTNELYSSNTKSIRLLNSKCSINTYQKSIVCKSRLGKGNETSQFLKNQLFYAMNLNVYRHKLEPYECEPGVCIPGQCDPYECQKRIMKRLTRKTSTMTHGATSSMASGTSMTPSQRARSQQNRHYEPRHRTTSLGEPEHFTTNSSNGRQAIRVGSSFNFNVEFFKDRSGGATDGYRHHNGSIKSSPSTREKKPRIKCTGTSCGVKPCVAKCTDVCNTKYRHGGSQSGPEMHHKGSMMSPKYKRCFCTMKLLKHGKMVTNQKGIAITTKNAPERDVILFNTKRQNTKKEFHHSTKSLDPHECEPGVCVPGQCDPYQCLERINARNKRYRHNGTGVHSGTVSSSSMSVDQPHKSNRQGTGYNDRTKSQKLIQRNHYDSSVSHPSRQVVRISSSFSFSVDFFKDKSGGPGYMPHVDTRDYKRENVKYRSNGAHYRPHSYRTKTRPGRTQGDVRSMTSSKSIQSGKERRNQHGQADTSKRHNATRTGNFLERCFCTAKLQAKRFESNKGQTGKKKIKKIKLNHTNSSIPADLTVSQVSGTGLSQKTSHSAIYADSGAQTKKFRPPNKKYIIDTHKNVLLPYECEPGVCVPGQCNPYKCAERIRKKSTRVDTMSYTGKPRSKSIYSGSLGSSSSKIQSSQPRYKTHLATSYDYRPASSYQRHYKNTPNSSTGRNALKLGSTFSFSMEFYKDGGNCGPDKRYSNGRDAKKRMNAITGPSTPGYRKNGKNVHASVSVQDSLSQVDPVKMRQKGIGPMLKRCFCTLGLQKPGFNEKNKCATKKCINTTSHGTDAPYCKVVPKIRSNNKQCTHTKPCKEKHHKLEPYECEPGVCIPGQCNPHDCIKIINKRLQRDAATEVGKKQLIDKKLQLIPQSHKMTNKYSPSIYHKRRARRGDLQSISSRQHLPHHHVTDDSDRQSVRIGSKINFSIEFYKDGNDHGDKNRYENHRRTHINDGHKRGTATYDDRSSIGLNSGDNRRRECPAQCDRHSMASTASGSGLLKRCFCTLKLQNLPKKRTDNHKAKPNASISYKKTGTGTHKIYPQVYPLLMPKECEGGFRVPGRSNAMNCLKRIKERMKKSTFDEDLSLFECEPGVCVPGQCDPYECLERMRKQGKLNKYGTHGGTTRDSICQYGTQKTRKEQGITTQCKTKDYCLQTCQKTNTKALAAKPLLLRRCFCTAKLLQQHAMKCKRYPTFTIGRADIFETTSPFKPHVKLHNNEEKFIKPNETRSFSAICFKKYEEDVIPCNRVVSLNNMLKSNTTSNDLICQKNNEEFARHKEMKIIWPYAAKKFNIFESNTLFSTYKQEYISKPPENTSYDKLLSVQEDSHLNTCIKEPTIHKSELSIFSHYTHRENNQFTSPFKNFEEVLFRDHLKKSESERKPQKLVYDPRTSQSVKIPKASSKASYSKRSKIIFSPLQAGDAKNNKNSVHLEQKNEVNKNLPKSDVQNVSSKSVFRNLVSKLKTARLINKLKNRFYKMFLNQTKAIDMTVRGHKINIVDLNDAKSKGGNKINTLVLNDTKTKADLIKAAGDTVRVNNDKHEKISEQFHKEMLLKKKRMGIQFALKGKHPQQIQTATFLRKKGRNNMLNTVKP